MSLLAGAPVPHPLTSRKPRAACTSQPVTSGQLLLTPFHPHQHTCPESNSLSFEVTAMFAAL